MIAKIYALIDKELLVKNGIDLREFIEFLNGLNVEIAQYRNKVGSLEEIKADLELIKPIFNGKLIINDYIELIDYADGLHLGQEDLINISIDYNEAMSKVRQKVGNKILGLSTHDINEISDSNRFDLDYIGLGAYRQTTTKDVYTVGGQELLQVAKSSIHKVALIGGIKLDDDFSDYPQIEYKVIGSDLVRAFLKQNSL